MVCHNKTNRFGPTCLSLLAVLSLAACGGDVPEEQRETTPPADQGATAPITAPTTTPAIADPEASEIPASLQGRWGLGVADCTPGRADAKGLLIIGPQRLEFYESVGILDKIKKREPEQLRALFNFTGEGMSWEREMLLEAKDNGSTLVRQDFEDGIEQEALHYKRC